MNIFAKNFWGNVQVKKGMSLPDYPPTVIFVKTENAAYTPNSFIDS